MKNVKLFRNFFCGNILAVSTTNNPQSNLTPDEAAICCRLREARLSLKLGQPDFAKELDIPASRAASYEYARAPVRFAVGFSLCERFNLSLRWLATGKLPNRPFTPIAPIILSKIGRRELFSVVYKKHLARIVESRLKDLKIERLGKGEFIWDFRRSGVSRAESHLENVIELIRSVASELDDETKLQFAFALERLAFSRSPMKSGAEQHEAVLDKPLPLADDSGVKKQICSLPELLKALRERTRLRGQKTALAGHCKVSRQAVNQWLAGSTNPSAEATFLALEWIQSPEAKTKSPSKVDAVPGQKVHRRSKHEMHKSSQEKR